MQADILDALDVLKQGGPAMWAIALLSLAMWRNILLGLHEYAAGLNDPPRTGRRASSILVLAALAPMLGLLGTVLGLAETFWDMARLGAERTQVMAPGLAKALSTTQAGLLAALPGLILGSFLQRRARRAGLLGKLRGSKP